MIGGEGMSQARQGALPSVGLRFFDNMLNEFLHPSAATIERAAGGAIMGACLVGEPCGAFEAGASLVVGGAAVKDSLDNH
jgi:hypothetical protein